MPTKHIREPSESTKDVSEQLEPISEPLEAAKDVSEQPAPAAGSDNNSYRYSIHTY